MCRAQRINSLLPDSKLWIWIDRVYKNFFWYLYQNRLYQYNQLTLNISVRFVADNLKVLTECNSSNQKPAIQQPLAGSFYQRDVSRLHHLITPVPTNNQLTTQTPAVDPCVSLHTCSVNVLYKLQKKSKGNSSIAWQAYTMNEQREYSWWQDEYLMNFKCSTPLQCL